MGWLKLGNRSEIGQKALGEPYGGLKAATEDIETVSVDDSGRIDYPPVDTSLPDSQLPFISPEAIMERKSKEDGGLLIVVDKVVYDCTQFIKEHPGGEQIIKSFGGAECSWQFWRFHGPKELAEFGKPLRVGRTEGLSNKFKEPSKYVGLRRLGADEW
ncbi:fatty acid desaturas-like protein [Leptodontidium sp. MPI-SDFR-AT-0119]|nr:fatty acid desaturas-like protein [Leptodontidium sp. MPI-SDFR-AT-0119]